VVGNVIASARQRTHCCAAIDGEILGESETQSRMANTSADVLLVNRFGSDHFKLTARLENGEINPQP
jgi:hypothetical protein